LPVQFGGLLALMRRASLTSSLMAPMIGSDRPRLNPKKRVEIVAAQQTQPIE
jgi:hypothetical protein